MCCFLVQKLPRVLYSSAQHFRVKVSSFFNHSLTQATVGAVVCESAAFRDTCQHQYSVDYDLERWKLK